MKVFLLGILSLISFAAFANPSTSSNCITELRADRGANEGEDIVVSDFDSPDITKFDVTTKLNGYLTAAKAKCQPRVCHANTKTLLSNILKGEGADFLSKGRTAVLYIHESDWNTLEASRSSTIADGSIWHVVLYTYGYVLDLDFSATPMAVSPSQYMARIFGSNMNFNNPQNLMVRPIPFKDYLDFGSFTRYAWQAVDARANVIASQLYRNDSDHWRQVAGRYDYLSAYNDAYRLLFTEASYRQYPPMQMGTYFSRNP